MEEARLNQSKVESFSPTQEETCAMTRIRGWPKDEKNPYDSLWFGNDSWQVESKWTIPLSRTVLTKTTGDRDCTRVFYFCDQLCRQILEQRASVLRECGSDSISVDDEMQENILEESGSNVARNSRIQAKIGFRSRCKVYRGWFFDSDSNISAMGNLLPRSVWKRVRKVKLQWPPKA